MQLFTSMLNGPRYALLLLSVCLLKSDPQKLVFMTVRIPFPPAYSNNLLLKVCPPLCTNPTHMNVCEYTLTAWQDIAVLLSSSTLLTTAVTLGWAKVEFAVIPSPFLLSLSLDSRLGGWQHQQRAVQPGLMVDTRIQVYSTVPKPFIRTSCGAGGPAGSLPSRDSDFWVEHFDDGWEADVFSGRAALLLTYTPFNNLIL